MSNFNEKFDFVAYARHNNQRSGQLLFNLLPDWATEVISGTIFDPFYKELSNDEIGEWIANHLIFNSKKEIVAVFNKNRILVQRSSLS